MGKGGRSDLDGPLALPVAPHRLRRMRQELGPEPLLVGQILGERHLRHVDLVVEAGLVLLEGGRHREDRLAVLHRHHPARRKARAVADAIDLVDDRHAGIAGPHEIGMQGMHEAVLFHCALRRHQRLGDDLAAEHPLPAGLRAEAAIQVLLDRLDIENGDQLLHGGGGAGALRHFGQTPAV